MTICRMCGREKSRVDSCIETVIVIDGVRHPPVPHRRSRSTPFDPPPARCTQCNAAPGGFHHVGCMMELCPICGIKWVFCRCQGWKERLDPEDLPDAKIIPFPGTSVPRG